MAHRLSTGEHLTHGHSLRSQNGRYVLEMQNDANLVLYAPGHTATWATGTDGKGKNCVLRMQDDGNLVIYSEGHEAIWDSGTAGKQNCVLELQDDANLVIYARGHEAVWASGTDLRNMRLEIVENGTPSRDGGQRIANQTNQTIKISAGSLAIDVPPGGEGGVILGDADRPAKIDVHAKSGRANIVVGQLAVDSGGPDGPGDAQRGRRLTSTGDLM